MEKTPKQQIITGLEFMSALDKLRNGQNLKEINIPHYLLHYLQNIPSEALENWQVAEHLIKIHTPYPTHSFLFQKILNPLASQYVDPAFNLIKEYCISDPYQEFSKLFFIPSVPLPKINTQLTNTDDIPIVENIFKSPQRLDSILNYLQTDFRPVIELQHELRSFTHALTRISKEIFVDFINKLPPNSVIEWYEFIKIWREISGFALVQSIPVDDLTGIKLSNHFENISEFTHEEMLYENVTRRINKWLPSVSPDPTNLKALSEIESSALIQRHISKAQSSYETLKNHLMDLGQESLIPNLIVELLTESSLVISGFLAAPYEMGQLPKPSLMKFLYILSDKKFGEEYRHFPLDRQNNALNYRCTGQSYTEEIFEALLSNFDFLNQKRLQKRPKPRELSYDYPSDVDKILIREKGHSSNLQNEVFSGCLMKLVLKAIKILKLT